MVDGMLAVYAQCGCCHHFHIFCEVILCPFFFCLVLLCLTLLGFSFGLLPLLLYVIWFCQIHFAYDITWFDDLFFVYLITWCMCYGDYRLYLGGGSYSSVYVPPPVFVSPVVLVVCIHMFFISPFILYLSYVWYAYFLVHISPGFAFSQFCEF